MSFLQSSTATYKKIIICITVVMVLHFFFFFLFLLEDVTVLQFSNNTSDVFYYCLDVPHAMSNSSLSGPGR